MVRIHTAKSISNPFDATAEAFIEGAATDPGMVGYTRDTPAGGYTINGLGKVAEVLILINAN